MQIQINTDRNIEGHEALVNWASGVVRDALDRFSDSVTRVEVHVGAETGGQSGLPDKRCVMEARVERHAPMAATHHAQNLHQAVTGAAEKLTHLLESSLGRAARNQAGRRAP